VPLWLVLVLCTSWEPVIRDGWGHYFWHRDRDLSLGELWRSGVYAYEFGNPRLGQTYTLLLHTPGPWHSIVTPLVELAVFALAAMLALGRRLQLSRTDDALVFATTVAIVFACAPALGPMLLYRPYTGNYVYSLLPCLAWLLPYRCHAAAPLRARRWWAPALFALGVIAGFSNELFGPGLALAGVVAIALYWRRGERFVPWAYAGLLGMLAGCILLLVAPGQDVRYAGLATEDTMLGRIVERGVVENAKLFFALFGFLAPALVWLALGVIARLRNRTPASRADTLSRLAVVAFACVLALTMLLAPKQGYRMYFAPIVVVSAALASWLVAHVGRIERWIAGALAVAVIIPISIKLAVTYRRAGLEFDERLAVIMKAAPNSKVVVPLYSQPASRYIVGDDLLDPRIRESLALQFHLASIEALDLSD
jgi:hypothetical protein